MHEAKSHPHNCWVTLTYHDDALPTRYYTGILNPVTGKPIYGGTLHKPDMQKLFRRIRKTSVHAETDQLQQQPLSIKGNPLRYYYCGEYGEKYKRPHYHACLFGIDFADKKLLKHTDQEYRLYESELLKTLWPHGQHIITELTWQNAAYTARYSLAKVNGQLQEQYQTYKTKNNTVIKKHYEQIDYNTGEIITLQQEYNDMSRKPGIGHNWLQKWEQDVYHTDTSYVRIRGNKTQPPRYYDKLHKRNNPEHYEHIQKERAKATRNHWLNNTQERLNDEEIITTRKIITLKQHLETN